MRNPREVRQAMHTHWDQYVHGEVPYLRIGFDVDPEEFPKKTQPLARKIAEERARIAEDKAFFDDAVNVAVNKAWDSIETGENGNGLVATLVGRNMVKLASVTVTEGEARPTVMLGEFPAEEFVEAFAGTDLAENVAGRSAVMTAGGMIVPGEVDLAIVRQSNVALLLEAQEPAA